jgi:hypothetical protein
MSESVTKSSCGYRPFRMADAFATALLELRAPPHERVQRGARLLDSTGLPWHRHVQISDLDLKTEDNCVLGQLWGSYGLAVMFLRIAHGVKRDFAALVRHGFDGTDVDELHAAWETEIVARRASSASRSRRLDHALAESA